MTYWKLFRARPVAAGVFKNTSARYGGKEAGSTVTLVLFLYLLAWFSVGVAPPVLVLSTYGYLDSRVEYKCCRNHRRGTKMTLKTLSCSPLGDWGCSKNTSVETLETHFWVAMEAKRVPFEAKLPFGSNAKWYQNRSWGTLAGVSKTISSKGRFPRESLEHFWGTWWVLVAILVPVGFQLGL